MGNRSKGNGRRTRGDQRRRMRRLYLVGKDYGSIKKRRAAEQAEANKAAKDAQREADRALSA